MSQFANLGVLCRRAAVGESVRPLVRGRGLRMVVGGRRGMASAKAVEGDDGKLPLKGVRVLDMTRVLAGVCIPPICLMSSLTMWNWTANAD
jgi:hypothetical protein